ncbi:MAG: hypothetical protein HUU46_12840 [Candidatus Hydrogenedentes bacterium]|nr:hypothetical protein [Candidatus Hydrogenedentota bacterium]
MPTLQEIESQIAALSKEDLVAFSAWFDEFQAEAWERQIEADSRAGRLDGPIERAMRDDADGKSTPL